MSLSIRRSGTIAFGRIFTTVVRHSSQKRTQRCCLTNRFLNAPKTRSLITMAEKPNPAVSGTYGNLPGTSWTVELLPGTLPETKIGTGEIGEYETDLLAIGVYADIFETTKNGDTEVVTCTSDALMSKDDVLGGALAHILAKGDFKGEAGTSSVTRGSGSIRYVGLFGLGKKAEATVVPKWGRSVYFKYGENVGNTAKSNRTETVSIVFESQPESGLNTALSQLVFGILLNPFETFRFKEKADKKTPLKTISVMNVDPNVQSDIKKGYANANGSLLAMYSIESPPNVCYPQYLVDVATLIANKYKSTFKLKVLEKKDCEKLNMGLYLAVANGSETPPKFIHLTYSKGTPKKTLAIVGKGITFDSGGYNIKAGAGSRIEDMKFDMGGSAATLGSAYILGDLAPDNITVHFLIASCENMIKGDAYRPGDIITASNGKSVEVLNTDAEGRLTLADALLYAQEHCKATSIVNIATLTGNILMALGEKIAGMFTPSDAMATALVEASQRTGDRIWRMPLEKDYLEYLTKGVADLKNIGGKYGGAIVAGLFLKEFVKTDEVEWAHLDIAGAAWRSDKQAPTGFGASLLAEWVLGQSDS